jgi:hydrogenase maturation protease
MSQPRILVAGIGNIFLGDDAFGVEVAQRLSRRKLPDGVRVVDFGIRGLDLAYALMEEYDLAILVDATRQGAEPGALYVVEPEWTGPEAVDGAPLLDAHGMHPLRVLQMVRELGGRPKRVLVVGCEPATLGDELEGAMGLSAPVASAVNGAIGLIESLVAKAMEEHHAGMLA